MAGIDFEAEREYDEWLAARKAEKATRDAHNAACVARPITTRKKPAANDADTPLEELVLAKMLQSAWARGLKPHMYSMYNDADEPTACCALGAFNLDELGASPHFAQIGRGNDTYDLAIHDAGQIRDYDGYALGAAFQVAMRDEHE